ncbi:Survival protein SurA precursor (Peptidyl-prolyl cis-trans isomerase SurA) [Minicystis rosea]|nr:Survival protein SurA precursor (Peptidyl-prolyl cis-trans isomerase SurA) [Minicystis rosea]
MRLLRPVVAAALACAALLAAAPSRAEPKVIERAVAVVGGEPITLTELRRRATPALRNIWNGQDPSWKKAEQSRAVLAATLDGLIDEVLIARAAKAAGIEITTAQVDDMLDRTAKSQGITRADLLGRGLLTGWVESDMRADLKRQLCAVYVLRLTYQKAHDEALPEGEDEAAVKVRHAWRAQWLATQRRLWGVERRLVLPAGP